MGFHFGAKSKTVYFEFRDYVIRYVEPKRLSAPVTANELYLPPGIVKNGVIQDRQAFETILRSCARRWGLHHRRVQFLVPDSYVIVRKQLIPSDITDEEIRGHIFLELGRSIHLPFDHPTFDFVLMGEKEGKRELIIFAAPEEAVQDFAGALEKSKLRPVRAEIAATSLYQLYAFMEQPQSGEELLLLRLDMFQATVTIFHNGYPVFMQQQSLQTENAIEVTEAGVTVHHKQETAEAMDEVFEELDRILHFYKYSFMAGTGTISKYLVTGDYPMLSEAVAAMRERFTFSVELMQYQIADATGQELDSRYYPSLGLSYEGR